MARYRTSTRVVAAAVVAVVVLGGALLLPPPAVAKSPALHVGSVSAIVTHDFALNNEANATLSYVVQGRDEGGSALAIDDSVFRFHKIAGDRTLEGARYYPFFGRVVSSSVPAQSSYPVRFAAEVVESSAPGTPRADVGCAGSGVLDVVTKVAASGPWRVTLEPYVPSIAALPRFTSAHGHGRFATSQRLAMPLASLASAVVASLEHRAATGAGTTLVPGGDFVTNACGHFEMWDPHLWSGSHSGLTSTSQLSAATPADEVAFATVGGGALAAFTVTERYTERPAVAGDYVIWSHGTYTAWDLLPVGHYASVTVVVDQEVAVLDPAVRSGQAAHVVGAYGGVVSVTGTPVA